MNKTVSVIIPTYNRAKIISRTIDSVLNQTYKDIEIIVVDDGSKDDTKEVLKKYKKKIKYVYKENGGVSSARNLGVKEASGDWIAFLDSDDEWTPDKLSVQMDCLAKTSLEICFCDSKKDFEKTDKKQETSWKIYDDPFDLVLDTSKTLFIQAVVIKKELFEKVGFFDEELIVAEDTAIIYKLAFETPFLYINQALLFCNSDDDMDRLTEWSYEAKKMRAKFGYPIITHAYAKYQQDKKKNIKALRKLLGFFASENAIILYFDGKKYLAKQYAKDSLFYGVNFKSRIINYMLLYTPKVLEVIYKKKFKK